MPKRTWASHPETASIGIDHRNHTEGYLSTVDELLAYFRQAIEHPETVQPWNKWWTENASRVESAFPREDFLRLKYRKLQGARTILERSGWTPADESSLQPIQSGFCNVCGERLFSMHSDTTKEEIIQFGIRAGIKQCASGYGLHDGLYCPNHCTQLMIEYCRDPSNEVT